ncbi:MAG: hypothetical protein P1U78_11225 [Alcanivoracaceae bacterium]|nr:hypothetical protein [Alcanivoracaceae bacterium]
MMHASGREETLRKGWNQAAKWFAGDGTDYEVAIDINKTDGKGGWTFVTYLLTLSLLPYVETNTYESTMELRSGDAVLFSNTDSFAVKESLSVYFPTALLFGTQGSGPLNSITSDQLNRHALALGRHIAEGRGAYQAAVQGGTVATYREYLANNPTSFFRMDALQQLAGLAPSTKPLAFHRENLAIDERYARFIPSAQAVWFIGPEGMKVADVLAKQAGEDVDLLASRIRASGQTYKVFNDEEVAAMKQGGLKPALIAAMIDASAGQSAAPVITPAAAAPVAVQPPVSVQPADASAAAPTAGDIAADCAKRLAAMQACNQIPSFGKNICKAQVRKTYDHLVCSVIQ